jgi:hypothetical protein
VSSLFTLARTASETRPIKAASQITDSKITARPAKHDPVSCQIKTVALSVFRGTFETYHRIAECPFPGLDGSE